MTTQVSLPPTKTANTPQTIDYFITRDEFLRVLERETKILGLELKLESSSITESSDSRKQETFKQNSEDYSVKGEREVVYRLLQKGYDRHCREEPGKDLYESMLADANGNPLLISTFRYQTSRPGFDEEEFLPQPYSATTLLSSDPLAQRIFELAKQASQRSFRKSA